MIHRLYSSLATFKNLTFHDELNVIVAEKTKGASDQQTRNRAGKSSIAEIMHFLLGGNVEKKSVFSEECLQEVDFGLDFDLGGCPVTVERQVQERRNLKFVKGDYLHWPIQPSVDKQTSNLIISNTHWKHVLGKLIFATPESETKFGPTVRSALSYFVRRQQAGAFLNPFQQSKDQKLYDIQVNLSYLLGFDWTIPQHWQQIREKENALKTLKTATKKGTLGDIILSSSDLRTQLTIAEDHAKNVRQSISNFKVLPEYRELEQEASDLTHKIGDLNDDNTLDRQLISELQASVDQETPPSNDRLEKIYKEAGVVLPDVAIKQLDQVQAFHRSIVVNRQSYLEQEISDAQQRIDQREANIRRHEQRRSEIMNILHSHGALDHFSKLQKELTRLETEVETIRQRYTTAEQLETGKTDLDLERQQLLRRLRQDYQEQEEILKQAILAFEKVSNQLYEVAGNLVIEPSLNGPQFEVKIHGQRSRGISNMQIFCFDMMLMQLCTERGISPGFLFHDSHIFDGVDERQVAKALQIGAENAQKLGYQYIMTMNQDDVPSEFASGFKFDEYVLSTHLTDATENGGLFGIRFG